MVRDFPAPASGQNRQDLPSLLKTVFPAKEFPRESGLDVSNQGMADELHGHTGIGIELFFEVKNTERFGKAAANKIYAPGAPGPKLRADVIDVSDALRV